MQNESFPNFSNFRPEFCPEFCSEFSPNFSRTFRASFRGRRRPEKIHQNPHHFSIQNSQANTKENTHKILLESWQSKVLFSLTFHVPKRTSQNSPSLAQNSVSSLFRRNCSETPNSIPPVPISDIPGGPARHLNASQQKLTPHCLAGSFDLQLPSVDSSATAEGQQLQAKQTSDATSLLRLCSRRISVCHSGKGTLDVAFRVARDEGRSCHCRPFEGSYRCLSRPSGIMIAFDPMYRRASRCLYVLG